ncbi:hypothetical protein BEP19_16450 [Ammoniphilus oxalaticus]|uniref:Uncharacterized protein n=1 Tax=Ammoniphilus oxalaticus TaxID=66863 RepID=A0A419SQW2_9BACL|nr:hypothetical protein [Ammoniphilus oxalaticus]RKD26787.1 hypothetical protein BEP19_16450 [Ammoniphilus oxalaticus]
MDVEKELEKLLTEGELEKQDKQLEAVKRLPPKWVAVYPSSFHQVDEENKLLRKFVNEAERDKEKESK